MRFLCSTLYKLPHFQGSLEKRVKVGTNDEHIVVAAHGKGEYSEIGEMKSYRCAIAYFCPVVIGAAYREVTIIDSTVLKGHVYKTPSLNFVLNQLDASLRSASILFRHLCPGFKCL